MVFPNSGSTTGSAKNFANSVLSTSGKIFSGGVKGVRDTMLVNRKSLKTLTANVLTRPTSTQDIKQTFDLKEELGKGQFGVTRLAVNKADKEEVAVKSLFKRNLQTKEDVDDIRREASVMALLKDHPNVVHLKGTFEDRHHVHFVMELCKGGELLKRIINKKINSEYDMAKAMRTIMEVVAFCHESGICHRDLKPENVLLANDSDVAPLKVMDFGLAAYCKPGQKLTQPVGSAFYMAPEVLKGEYGLECDVWSCGVILYVLLSGRPPFSGNSKEQIHKAILEGKLGFEGEPWPEISDAAKDLVKAMLTMDPSKRITAKEALENPWLKGDKAPKAPLNAEVGRRLQKFSEANKMKKLALKVVACNLSKDEIMGLRELFRKMDADKSGSITFNELKEGLKSVGSNMSEEQLQALWKAADVDNSNSIDYTEFITATMQMNLAQKDEHMWAAFQHFDKDGSGKISVTELREALLKENMLEESELDAIVKEVDTDGNGVIDYEEFLVMMKVAA